MTGGTPTEHEPDWADQRDREDSLAQHTPEYYDQRALDAFERYLDQIGGNF